MPLGGPCDIGGAGRDEDVEPEHPRPFDARRAVTGGAARRAGRKAEASRTKETSCFANTPKLVRNPGGKQAVADVRFGLVSNGEIATRFERRGRGEDIRTIRMRTPGDSETRVIDAMERKRLRYALTRRTRHASAGKPWSGRPEPANFTRSRPSMMPLLGPRKNTMNTRRRNRR